MREPKNMQSDARKIHMNIFLLLTPVEVACAPCPWSGAASVVATAAVLMGGG
jgi:hypothetical protein